MTTDLISNMLTHIRNASLAKHTFTLIPFSNLNIAILKVLKKEGYIKNFEIKEKDNKIFKIEVFLRYKGWWVKKPFFSKLKRISKPGQRIYSGYKEFEKKINALKYQQGIAIISTSIGVMSHLKASQFKKGGEILCYIE
jgi:small subunit ribosomal protein S8